MRLPHRPPWPRPDPQSSWRGFARRSGFLYSGGRNKFLLLSSFRISQRAPDALGSQWQLPYSNAGSVDDGVGDGRRNGNDTGFAHAFGAIGSRAVPVFYQFGFEYLRQVGHERHAIIDQIRI